MSVCLAIRQVRDNLLPSGGGLDFDGLVLHGNATNSDGSDCDAACVFQNIFAFTVDVPVLMIFVVMLIASVVFSQVIEYCTAH